MLIINCPYCGPREESEFACGGEAHIARPLAENSINDAEFAEYLFLRDNPKGLFLERWRHTAGCALPRKAEALETYTASWRRDTTAEKAAQKPSQHNAAAKKTGGTASRQEGR